MYISVHCKCKVERTWFLTCPCACVKVKVNCSIACHGAKKRLKIRNRKEEAQDGQEQSERQFKDSSGKLEKSLK